MLTRDKYISTKDHLLTGESFDLYGKDGILETVPIPKNLSKYYKTENYISHSDTKQHLFDKLYHIIKGIAIDSKLKTALKYCPNAKTILDVGAGTGDFLLSAKQRGLEVEGVEPDVTARHNAKTKGISLEESYPEKKNFDIITLWHVLEHIWDIHGSLEVFKQILSPGGVLLIAVPNHNSWDAHYYKSYWAGYDVPRHIWHFSRKGLIDLMAMYNWKHVKTHPMWFDAFYVSMLSEKYRGAQKFSMSVRGFISGLISNMSAIFSKEFSSNIFVFKKI